MCVSILPKLSVSKTIGKIKGKSAAMIFSGPPWYREMTVTFGDEDIIAKRYVNEETKKQYIQEQYEGNRMEGNFRK